MNVGDKVKIINYGSKIWSNEKLLDDTNFLGKAKIGKTIVNLYDMTPEIVGKESTISDVIVTQGITKYSLQSYGPYKVAWFNEDQLELIKE